MSSYIQNYGFTKTIVNNNRKKINNEIQWHGDYDGKVANVDLTINDNGHKEDVSLQLTNHDLIELFGTKPVEMPLDERLYNDFILNDDDSLKYSPMVLEGALIPSSPSHLQQHPLHMVTYNRKQHKKSKKYRKGKRRQTYRHRY